MPASVVMWWARLDTSVVDIGPPADWVKINVQKTVSLSSVQVEYNLCNCVIYSSNESFVYREIVSRSMP